MGSPSSPAPCVFPPDTPIPWSHTVWMGHCPRRGILTGSRYKPPGSPLGPNDACGEYVPAAQSSHAVLASASASFFPAAHGSHDVAPSSLYVPAGHRVHAVAGPSRSTSPATQGMQPTVEPSVYEPGAAYVPAAQETHAVAGSLSSSWSPAWQSVHDAAAAGEKVPAPQAMQAVVPSVPWYVPARQSVQSLCPCALMYLPAGHAMHPALPWLG